MEDEKFGDMGEGDAVSKFPGPEAEAPPRMSKGRSDSLVLSTTNEEQLWVRLHNFTKTKMYRNLQQDDCKKN